MTRAKDNSQSRAGAAPAIILFALDIEARPTLRLLKDSKPLRFEHSRGRSGTLATAPYVVAVIGAAGEARAAQAAAELLEQVQPSFAVSAGFAGALRDDLKIGDIVLPGCVTNERQEEIAVEPWGTEPTAGAAIHSGGRLLTLSRFVGSVAERRALAERHSALACDMETWAVAEACRKASTPFRSLRIISDGLADEFPPEMDRLLAASSPGRQALVAATAVLRRPPLARELWRLNRTARRAAATLAEYLHAMFSSRGDGRK